VRRVSDFAALGRSGDPGRAAGASNLGSAARLRAASSDFDQLEAELPNHERDRFSRRTTDRRDEGPCLTARAGFDLLPRNAIIRETWRAGAMLDDVAAGSSGSKQGRAPRGGSGTSFKEEPLAPTSPLWAASTGFCSRPHTSPGVPGADSGPRQPGSIS